MESHLSSNRITNINNLSESAYVAGNINTSGGDFIGRDKYIQGDEVHGNKIIYQSLAFPRLKYRNDIAGVLDFYTNIFVG